MRRLPSWLTLSASVLLAAGSLTAQVRFGDFGFTVRSADGEAGDTCWGFDCTPRPLTAPSSDTLRLVVRAPLGAPYLVAIAPAAAACMPVPGIWHELVLQPFPIPLVGGTVDLPNPGRFCYDGFGTLRIPLPPAAPGTRIAFQAVAVIGTPIQPQTGWALSSAVLLTIR